MLVRHWNHPPTLLRHAVVLIALFALPLVAPAQGLQEVLVESSSGVQQNPGEQAQILWSDVIEVPNATSVQLRFSVAMLPTDEDKIIVTSTLDGEQMILTRSLLKNFQNHTAWFNGPVVTVSLVVAPGSSASVTIDTALADSPPLFPETICGLVDNRVVTTDDRTCRVVPSGTSVCSFPGPCAASAWRIADSEAIATARHVAILNFFTIAEFNCPASNATTGAIAHPPVADQYPILAGTIEQSAATTVGADWAVATLGLNSNGQSATERYGTGFTIAGSMPSTGTTLRITGNGIDNTPNPSRHHRTQTATGPLTAVSGTTVSYQVDTTNGSSGSGVRNNATGQIIAIHTNGGCGVTAGGATSGANSGTSIFNTGLQSALTSQTTCQTLTLSSGISESISSACAQAAYYFTPTASKWNVVGVTSSSDWDMRLGSTTSAWGSTSCDFLLANGHQGTIPAGDFPGRMYRFSGSAAARGEWVSANSTSIGNTYSSSWSSTDVVRAVEFEVTSAGSFDITVSGSSDLNWRLYAPGSNADWRTRSSATLVASGTVGNATVQGAALGTGWHCLVVYKDGGVASVSPTSFAVTVCDATTSILLVDNTPATITNPCQDFRITAVANEWNVVGISSPSDWDLVLGSATSYTGGADFALANGHLGAISPTWGQVNRFAGSSDGTMEHQDANSLSASGGNTVTPFSASEILDLREVNLTSTGTYAITVTGDSSVAWRFYAPQSDSGWIRESDSAASGNGGGGTVNVNVTETGYHALLLYRNNGPSTATTVMSNICSVSSSTTLTSISVATLAGPCAPFTFTPESGKWNAVGIASTSDWDIGVGPAYARSGSGQTDYVITNGRNGAISPTNGIASRFSGVNDARVQRSFNVTLSLGSQYNANWPATYVVRMFEFDVPSPGSYGITLSGSSDLSWRLHEPGADASWRSDGDYVSLGTANGTTVTRTFATPGWHAISVVHHVSMPAASISFQVLVDQTPNPVPSTSSLSPSSAIAGGASFTLTVNGSDFVSGSQIRFGGTPLATTFVNSSQLTGTVSAGMTAAAGLVAVDVSNPAPGGGISPSQTFTVDNPVPSITSTTPNTAIVGSGAFLINVNGSNFNSSSVVRFNSNSLATTFVSANSVMATVPNSMASTAGIVSVGVNNPAPGGGFAATSFTVENPVPTLSSLAPTFAIAGDAMFTMNVNGSDFISGDSVVRWNGAALPTAFVAATQLQATVSAALIAAAGSANVDVDTAGPGGGSSTQLPFPILAPAIISIAPASIPILTAASPAQAITITGANFHSGTQAYADGYALPTTYLNSSTLTCDVGPTVLGALRRGGLAIAVENAHTVPSNAVACVVGGLGSNAGTIIRNPLAPNPGEAYVARCENGAPGRPLLLIADLTNPTPIYPWPSPAGDFVLAVRDTQPATPGNWFALLDGIGVFGPANPSAIYDATGAYSLGGLSLPNPAWGLTLTVQGAYTDPAAPLGFFVHWARYPEQL